MYSDVRIDNAMALSMRTSEYILDQLQKQNL